MFSLFHVQKFKWKTLSGELKKCWTTQGIELVCGIIWANLLDLLLCYIVPNLHTLEKSSIHVSLCCLLLWLNLQLCVIHVLGK